MDIDEMNNQVTNTKEFPTQKIDNSPIRFEYRHPLLLEDGSLTAISGLVYKIDFCSNLQWINDEEIFHHSKMLDHDGHIWVGGQMNPKSQYVKKYAIKGIGSWFITYTIHIFFYCRIISSTFVKYVALSDDTTYIFYSIQNNDYIT